MLYDSTAKIATATRSPEIFLVLGNTGLSADFTSGGAAGRYHKAALPKLCAATFTPHS